MADNDRQQHNLPPFDPRMMQAMYGAVEEDEIDLLAYGKLLWQHRKLIVLVPLMVSILVAGLTLVMPNIYKSEVLLAQVGNEDEQAGLSSMLGGLGGLASMAGVSLGGGGTVEENLAVLKSRAFIWKFVQDEKLMPVLFEDAWDAEQQRWIAEDKDDQPSLWAAWRLLVEDGVISTGVDKESGLVNLAVEWRDAELAALWASKLVKRLNSHLRNQAIELSHKKLTYLKKELMATRIAENRQALFALISAEQKQAMLANTQQDFAFRVIDAAAVPDKKIKPKRALLVIVAGFVVGFMCIVFVFVREGLRKRKEEDGLKDE
ncbi:MAG: GNVR domain-containing protein [Mariprofundaceae bacterium]|nr:GNVR domain-containing protein [Mariprofundaceae bacterium]